jgi:hypothetical protein
MKNSILSLLALTALACLPLLAQGGSGGGAIGSLPSASSDAELTNSGGNKTVTVAPGEKATAHGVTVQNGNLGEEPQYGGSDGKARIRQVNGGTEVRTDGGFAGKISGLSSGESATLGSNCNPVEVSGEGGTVNVGSGSCVTVKNVGNAADGASEIRVNLPGGASVTVPPGSQATFNT